MGSRRRSALARLKVSSTTARSTAMGLSLEKSRLTDYVGALSDAKQEQLDKALQIALALPQPGKDG